MLVSLTHIALHVRDLDACVEFYRHYAALHTVHERTQGNKRVIWLAEAGKIDAAVTIDQDGQAPAVPPGLDFILVLLPGGPGRDQLACDFSHLGFALDSVAAVDDIADQARAAGILEWEPRQEDYPVGYYCGIKDPDGNFVEFSYGQPLGPGAPDSGD
jgi:catechol 2,3-dioxygenase-like lactoylglutathione lyase family enzyme